MQRIAAMKEEYFKIRDNLRNRNTEYKKLSSAVKENALRFIETSNFKENLINKRLSVEEFKLRDFEDRFSGPENRHVHYEIRQLLDQIAVELSKKYAGRFIPDGSSADGTKIIRADEYDYLYELGIYNPVHFTHMSKGLACDATYNDRPLSAKEVFQKFSDDINRIARELTDNYLQFVGHGGFASPRFSGIRVNAPAVTLLFTWQDNINESKYLLSVDIAVGDSNP